MIPIIGEGTEHDPRAIRLATRDGTYIPNIRPPEMAPEFHKNAAALFKEKHANARLRSSTAVYNCAGQAFAARRTWVETDYVLSILKGDGYRPLKRREDLWVGDIVVYENAQREITHVAVVVELRPSIEQAETKIYVLSKWGHYGEYLHQLEDVHVYLGTPATFWTERREI